MHNNLGNNEITEAGDEAQQTNNCQNRKNQRHDDCPESLSMRSAIDLCGLIKFARNGVEETEEQEGVRTQRATEVDTDQAKLRVQAQNREDILNSQQEQEESHESQHLREHLDQKQEGQGSTTAAETEATEGVGSGCAHKDSSNGGHRRDDQRIENPLPVHAVLVTPQRLEVIKGQSIREADTGGQCRIRNKGHRKHVEQRDEAVNNHCDTHNVPPADFLPPT